MIELLDNEEVTTSVPDVKYSSSTGTLYLTSLRFVLAETSSDQVILSLNYDTIERQLKNPDTSKNILLKLPLKSVENTEGDKSGAPTAITFIFLSDQAVKNREKASKAFTEYRKVALQKVNGNGESRKRSNGEITTSGHGEASKTSHNGKPHPTKNSLPEDLSIQNPKLLLNKDTVSETEAKIRGNILSRNPNLAALHNSLVIHGTLSEQEFWENRQFLLRNQVLNDQQVKAQTSAWIDLKPSAQEGNEIRYTLTPEIIHDIFLQHPSVQKAYEDNVPDKISEANFWKRYFGSKYFHRNRSVGRVNVDTKDELFDELMKIDDEEANQLVNQYDINNAKLTLNLFASEQDHGETGNRPDITMRSGKRGDALSLIRRFNFHSEQVLKKSKPKVAQDEQMEFKEEILIEDLNPEPIPSSIPLDIHRKGLFSNLEDQLTVKEESSDVHSDSFFTNYFQNNKVDLKALVNETKGASDAMVEISTMVKSTNHLKRNATINDKDLKQSTLDSTLNLYQSCTELLRHFWAAHLNPTTNLEKQQTLQDKKSRMLVALTQLELQLQQMLDNLAQTAPEEKVAVDKLVGSLLDTLNQARKVTA